MTESTDLFTCPNHAGNLKISEASCASMWQRARSLRNESYNPIEACCGCAIGARCAGCDEDAQERKMGLIDHICTRCHRPATRFVYGRICISCYNRGREVMIGKNARGAVPKYLPAMISVHVAYQDDGVLRQVDVEQVADETEARLSLVRKSSHVLAFVRTPDLPINQDSVQMDLFGGRLFTNGSRRKPACKSAHLIAQGAPEYQQLNFFGE
ncbi:MAG TPA: hypothetical protein ENJ08_05825 [Gammaproteobacteria bacterium]|nr:hypothetical protein [Gammaproteobacteria bacterium]